MKVYATYLPGFHKDKLNCEWWGDNFTEWEIVKNAKPLYDNHEQPKIPQNGYYDLSKKESIGEQFKIASDYGIDAFLMYGYWSQGKQPLVKPFEIILENEDIDIKFAYFWGNHSWTRTWTNRKGSLDVLLEQEYDTKDMDLFFVFLLRLFKDKRYETYNGRPVFVIYKPEDIPDFKNFVYRFKEYMINNIGLEPFVIGCVTAWKKEYLWIDDVDSAMLFQPSFSIFGPEDVFTLNNENNINIFSQYIRSLPDKYKKYIYYIYDLLPEKYYVYDYLEITEKSIRQFLNFSEKYEKSIPMINVGFDNTPRYRGRAKILKNFKISFFKDAFKEIYSIMKSRKNKIIVINAWNEWGEGMFLEADKKYGNEKLDAVKAVINENT